MIIDVITIFPDMFSAPMSVSVIGSAQQKGLLEFRTHDLRDYTHDRHRTTDDYPYGGGPGMVMKPEPLFEAIEAVQAMEPEHGLVVFFTPAGETFSQARAHDFSRLERLIFVCGRYEGFDERALSLADVRLSIGDYVLTGGELPAMVVADAVTRLIPGVLGDDESSVEESFAEGLLEYPQFTRPPRFGGHEVPEVLRSGDHARIRQWRREQSIRLTARMRPELLATAHLSAAERELADKCLRAPEDAREDHDD